MISPRILGIAAAAMLLVIALGVGGYLLGEAKAPSAADATEAREAAHADARRSALKAASEASRKRGEREGVSGGRERGEQAGAEAGKRAGEAAAGEELAAIEAEEAEAAEAAATPEQACADLISDPGAYGQCLEENGQDPGAPLTDYCEANPEIVAQSGFCPSLNE